MGSNYNLYNELRGGLGPHEIIRANFTAVALRAWRVFTYSIAAIEPTVPLSITMAFTGLGLRFGWRRIDLVLPPENISCCVRTGSSVTDPQTAAKRIKTC